MINFDDVAEITDNSINGFKIIRIKSGEFKDVEFVYGGVFLSENENEDNATVHFEYNVTKGSPENVDNFNTLLGDLLVALIVDHLNKNELIYYGGTDESHN